MIGMEIIGMMALMLALVKMAEVVEKANYGTIARDIEDYLNTAAKDRADTLNLEMELFADGTFRLSFGQMVANERATVEAFAKSVAKHLRNATLPDGDFLHGNGNTRVIDREWFMDENNQPTTMKALRRAKAMPAVDSVVKARKFLSIDVGSKKHPKSLLTWYFQRIKASAKYVKKQNKPANEADDAAAPEVKVGFDQKLYEQLKADGVDATEAARIARGA